MTPAEIKNTLTHALPGAVVEVHDPLADGVHLEATITAPQFIGLPRVAQHRLVYAALGDAFSTTLHALALTTQAPR
jgi:stress-induced morphogen